MAVCTTPLVRLRPCALQLCAHTDPKTATNTTACCSAGPALPAAICSSLARRYGDAASEAAAASLAGEGGGQPHPAPLAAARRMRQPIDNVVPAVPAAAPQHTITTTLLALQ